MKEVLVPLGIGKGSYEKFLFTTWLTGKVTENSFSYYLVRGRKR